MPKKTYKILRFDGGINNDADARDIADHQLQHCKNMAVNSMGRLTGNLDNVAYIFTGTGVGIGGGGFAHAGFLPALSSNGHGFFAFSTDHTGFLNDTIAYPGIAYYLAEKAEGYVGIGSDGEEGALTIANLSQPVFYYVDGALRIGDADHASTSNTTWRGFIEEKEIGGTISTGADLDIAEQWYTRDAAITGAFPAIPEDHPDAAAGNISGITKNGLMLNIEYCLATESAFGDGHKAYDFNQYAYTTTADTNYNGYTAMESSPDEWGFALEFFEEENGSGTWMPQDSVKYKFYISTMYDDHTQESLPQLLRMFPTSEIHGGLTFNNTDIVTELVFSDGDSATPGENVKVSMKPVFKWVGTGENYNFGATTTDADGVTAGQEGNLRISGCRVYWASNEDGYTSLWQIYDAHFVEGVKVIGGDGGGGTTSGYSPWNDVPTNTHGGSQCATIADGSYSAFTNPPRFYQYDVLNAHSATDVVTVDSFKTAVVANRRAYIGNITQDGWIHGDRMLKSPVNQFDKFPSINNIDVAIHDGDEIVLLLEYADRILQFKENSLYIINVSGNTEYLEAEHRHKGISSPGAACRTDYGVAWVNKNGCFFYDGEKVTDLLEDQGQRKLSQACWSQFIGDKNFERIGFQPSTKQIIVKAGTDVDSDILGALGGHEGFFYDMIGKSWVYSSQIVETDSGGANCASFINDPLAGYLLWLNAPGNNIDYLRDGHSDNSESIDIITKDIDFGEPGVRKKIYKVYVSYRGRGSAIQIYYGVNGDLPTDTSKTFLDTLDDGTGDSNSLSPGTLHPLHDVEAGDDAPWVRAELKPLVSINNIYSFQLRFQGIIAYETSFEINDISIIYRVKGIK